MGHGTKIRYISFPDVHNLYSSLPEPKLLDHGTKIRYISFPEVLTRYRTKKYLLGTKFFVADRIKLWRIDIRYLVWGMLHPGPRSTPVTGYRDQYQSPVTRPGPSETVEVGILDTAGTYHSDRL